MSLDIEQKSIIDSTMMMHAIDPIKKTVDSVQLHKDMQIAINQQWNQDFWNYLTTQYDEKLIINSFFNGNRGYFEAMRKSLLDCKMEAQMIKNGVHPYMVSQNDAEKFHSKDSGSYKQIMLTDKNPVGTTNYSGEVKLIASNTIRKFSVRSLQSYMYEEYNIIVPIPDVTKMLKNINKQLDEQAKSMFSDGEDMITRFTREEIQKYSKDNKLSREETNLLMIQARNKSIAISRQFGRNIAALVVSEGTDREQRYSEKIMRLINENFIRPFEETGSLLTDSKKQRDIKKKVAKICDG